ncbi:hypothetical protein GCM10027404_10910 [Arthrobacter tumbae]|uniref:HNH endonuclease signature motif containing protein n=1 Tax=Arthrobacter tumbae TaxID=163874 RepID=UPI00195C1D3C|nr:HNH endonuclease signature motif containing protein [Arthrobacter tumbae]MBM7782371.1 hypothetical protein [Arthrobacter tumbae]
MGIGVGESLEDTFWVSLEDGYAQADATWPDELLEQAVFGEASDLDDSGVDDHARARIEDASPVGLVYRLEEGTSPHARQAALGGQGRGLAETLDLLRVADRLGAWVAARQASLTAEVFHQVHRSEIHDTGVRAAEIRRTEAAAAEAAEAAEAGAGASGAPGADVPGHAAGVAARAAVAGRVDAGFSFMLAVQEIAPLLRVPGKTASRLLGDALRLTEDLPATWEALDEGRISAVQAQVLVDESGCIPAEAVPGFEETVLGSAAGLTRPKLTRRCRRLREELHPESITVRKARAAKDREVLVQAEQDGMAWLNAYLPAEQAHGIFNRVDAAARSLQGPDEARTLAQLRADVFADVLTHTCTGDPKRGTGFRGIGATVFVTVPVMTLLGHSRTDWQKKPEDTTAGPATAGGPATATSTAAGSLDGSTGGPGSNADGKGSGATSGAFAPDVEGSARPDKVGVAVPDVAGCESGLLDGYGPIDPETARNLAGHAPSFTRILVHPETGAVLSVGRDRYRPPKHLQDWVRITNPTCLHPGCNRSSWSCDIDHITPWAHGGQTSLENLGPRCGLHHMLKTEGIWPAGTDDDGNHHVTSPGGKTYTIPPEPPPPF